MLKKTLVISVISVFLFLSSSALSVAINSTSFPDDNFRTLVLDKYSDGTGHVNATTPSIDAMELNISSLSGIGYYPYLLYLSCGGNNLTYLSLLGNSYLQIVSCPGNQLTTLYVTKSPDLRALYCHYNSLTSLDVSKNTLLTALSCQYNNLTSLNVSENTSLTSLYCDNNQLTSLDLSQNASLSTFDISPQRPGPIDCTFYNGTFNVDLNDLPNSDLIDMSRVSTIYGGTLDTSTGVISYIKRPSSAYYYYDTQKPGTTTTSMTVIVSLISPPLIDETTIPDDIFRALALAHYSYLDKYIEESTVEMDVSNQSISDLAGIEYYYALTTLNCSSNQLTALDLSQNTYLSTVNLSDQNVGPIACTFYDSLFNVDLNDLANSDLIDMSRVSIMYGGTLDPSTGIITYQSRPDSVYYQYDTQKPGSTTTSMTVIVSLISPPLIDETTFPDDNFRALALSYYSDSTNHVEENTTEIDVSNQRIKDLTGIEYYCALTTLNCSANQLAALDLSGNTELVSVMISEQTVGPLDCTNTDGSYTINLSDLSNSNLIDLSRVTITNGGVLDTSTGIVTYTSYPTVVTYLYDTENAGSGDRYMSVTVEVNQPNPDIPQTGDSSLLALWIWFAMLTLTVLLYIFSKLRSEHKPH